MWIRQILFSVRVQKYFPPEEIKILSQVCPMQYKNIYYSRVLPMTDNADLSKAFFFRQWHVVDRGLIVIHVKNAIYF